MQNNTMWACLLRSLFLLEMDKSALSTSCFWETEWIFTKEIYIITPITLKNKLCIPPLVLEDYWRIWAALISSKGVPIRGRRERRCCCVGGFRHGRSRPETRPTKPSRGQETTIPPQILLNRQKPCVPILFLTPQIIRGLICVLLSLWVTMVVVHSYMGALGDGHMGSGYRNRQTYRDDSAGFWIPLGTLPYWHQQIGSCVCFFLLPFPQTRAYVVTEQDALVDVLASSSFPPSKAMLELSLGLGIRGLLDVSTCLLVSGKCALFHSLEEIMRQTKCIVTKYQKCLQGAQISQGLFHAKCCHNNCM